MSAFERFRRKILNIDQEVVAERARRERESEVEILRRQAQNEQSSRRSEEGRRRIDSVVEASRILNTFERINREMLDGQGKVLNYGVAWDPGASGEDRGTLENRQGAGYWSTPGYYHSTIELDTNKDINLILRFRIEDKDGVKVGFSAQYFPTSQRIRKRYPTRASATYRPPGVSRNATEPAGYELAFAYYYVVMDGLTTGRQVNISDLPVVAEDCFSEMVYKAFKESRGLR